MKFSICLLVLGVLGIIKEKSVFEILGEDDLKYIHSAFPDKIRVISLYTMTPSGRSESVNIVPLSESLSDKSVPIIFSKLDRLHNKNKKLVSNSPLFGSNGVIYYLQNSQIPYIYPGKPAELLNFLQSKVHKIHKFSDIEEVKSAIMEKFYFSGLVLGVFSDNDVEAVEEFTSFSYDFIHIYNFGLLEYSEEVVDELNITGSSIVACRAPGLISFNDDYYRSTSDFTSTNIPEWVKHNIHPYIAYQTKVNEAYLPTDLPRITLYMDFSDKERRENVIDWVSFYSKQYFTEDTERKKFTFALADKNEYLKELESDRIGHLQMVFVVKDGQDKYVISEDVYKGNGEFVEKGLKKFFSDFNGKRAKKFVRTNEQVLAENRVLIASQKNFEKIVKMNKDSEVVLYFYKDVPKHIVVIEDLAKEVPKVAKINTSSIKLTDHFTSTKDEYIMLLHKNNDIPELYKGSWTLEKLKSFTSSPPKNSQDL